MYIKYINIYKIIIKISDKREVKINRPEYILGDK